MKKNILQIISLIALVTTSAHAEKPVTFADANLKAAVEKELKVTNPVPSQMKKLTALTANSLKISDITGLEYATNLTNLSLQHNEIQDISALSGLKNLTVLNLWENQITDITSVSNLTELKELWLAENKIGDISALSSLTKLEKLFLFRCDINDISVVDRFENLKGLSLHHNKICDISPVAKLVNLEFLWLGANEICDISPVAELTDLPRLSIYENQISDISALSDMTQLTLLEMHENKITDISVLSNKTNLTMLKLYDNQISDASPAVFLQKLKTLSLKGNPVKNLGMPLSEVKNLKIELGPVQYTNFIISEQEDHPTGRIRVNDKLTELVVTCYGREISITPDDNEVVLPTGEYNYVRWTVKHKDKDDNIWELKGIAFGSNVSFSVVENIVIELKVGEPIVGTLTAVRSPRGYYLLSQQMNGSLGETVRIFKNGSKPEAPSVRIVNAGSTYDETFKFKYG